MEKENRCNLFEIMNDHCRIRLFTLVIIIYGNPLIIFYYKVFLGETMEIKLNTSRDAEFSIFKSWQKHIIDCIESVGVMPINTRDIHSYVLMYETVSRASVITFCEALESYDLLASETKSGKGGYHKLYKLKHDREFFDSSVCAMLLNHLILAMPKVDVEKVLAIVKADLI